VDKTPRGAGFICKGGKRGGILNFKMAKNRPSKMLEERGIVWDVQCCRRTKRIMMQGKKDQNEAGVAVVEEKGGRRNGIFGLGASDDKFGIRQLRKSGHRGGMRV